jgi:hypothetical protein
MPNNTDKLRQYYVGLSKAIETVKSGKNVAPSTAMDFLIEETTTQLQMLLALVQDEIKQIGETADAS